MQEFVKGGQARSRVFAGHLYDVLDVKAAEVQLKEQRGGKTRIFWAPKTRFVPVAADAMADAAVERSVAMLAGYGDTPPGYPGAMVDDRELESLSEPPMDVVVHPEWKGNVAIVVPTDPKEFHPGDPTAVAGDFFTAGEGALDVSTRVVYEVLGMGDQSLNLQGRTGPAFWAPFVKYEPINLRGESLRRVMGETPLPPAQRTPGYDEDGHWTENVLTENPVEGRIHVEASHANALNELAFILANAMDAKGFNDLKDIDPESPAFNVTIGNKLMLAVGELAEAQEELRAGHSYAEIYEKDGKPEGFAVEIADAVYRLLHLAAALGIDIGLVLLQKHEFNLTRPHKHGKQF